MRIVTLAAPFALVAVYGAPALAEPGAFGGPKMLLHGNYCGPGNNAPLPPIDALDAACARHDACTPNGGLPNRACNLRLQRDAEAIERDPRQPEDLRALAGIVAAGTVLIPVEPDRRLVANSARPDPAAVQRSSPAAPTLPEDADGAE